MRILQNISKLLDQVEYLPATLAVTLLGGAVGGGGAEIRLLLAFLSNLLLFSCAVVYEKIESAPADVYETELAQQNPIAAGEVSLRFARTTGVVLALLSLAAAAMLGPLNIVLVFFGFLISIALSHHSLRLGSAPLMRLEKHQALLSAIFGLSGFLATAQHLKFEAILLVVFLLSIGILFAAWTAESAPKLLRKPFLIVLFVFASGSAYVLFVVFEAISPLVLLLIVLASLILTWARNRFSSQKQSLPQILLDSLIISTALSLILTHLIPLFL